MQKIKDTIYYSASDIVNFLECEHLTALDLINLETPLPQATAKWGGEKVGRNDPCPCGSGKKYKKCCGK